MGSLHLDDAHGEPSRDPSGQPRTWIERTDYVDQEFAPSLRALTLQRSDLLAVLEPLRSDDWSRAATITGAARPLERTVLHYADWLARHERTHLKQVQAAVYSVRSP